MIRLVMAVCAAALLSGCGEQKTDQAATPQGPAIAAPPAANPLKNAYFGDLHMHTRNSFDAYIFNLLNSDNELSLSTMRLQTTSSEFVPDFWAKPRRIMLRAGFSF